ncbi:MAG: Transcription-repair-coupling factor [Pseudomonadales bacterium]|nr:Transcription-repair-coupling factor [Pseudomonadales bacterium]
MPASFPVYLSQIIMLASLSLPALPRAGDRLRWGGLVPGADALAIAAVARAHPATLVVISASSAGAERIADDLGFFLDGHQRSVLRLPDWETLPYDRFSPHQDLVSDRLLALSRLARGEPVLLIVPVATLMQRIAPVAHVSAATLALAPGQRLRIATLRETLLCAGYRLADNVYEHGEFAVRGSIVDLFPMGHDTPVRIELFDDEIETLRSFDPETQRSLAPLARLALLPGREYPFDAAAIEGFRRRWHARFEHDHRACPDYRDVARGIAPGGIEYFLPLFFDACATLFDYLPRDCLLCVEDGAREEIERVWQQVEERHRSLAGDLTRPLLAPAEICLRPDEVLGGMKPFARIDFGPAPAPQRAGAHDFATREPPPIDERRERDAPARIAALAAAPGYGRRLFCAESAGRREVLNELLTRAGIKAPLVTGWDEFAAGDMPVALTIAPLAGSFGLEAPPWLLIAESALFGKRVMQRRRRTRAADGWDSAIRDLSELAAGAPVVHLDHGVGRYLGLQTLEVAGEHGEFLCIEYAEQAKLFVPVTSLGLVSRYTGIDGDAVPLHRLGSDQWARARRKAQEQIRDVAAELLEIHARREARPGHAFPHPGAAYDAFAAGFPFEETPDQQAAIDAVIGDMCAPRAMDRLVCGDVGFGKTEVAMRAAFVAVHAGRQVAVLVPTTLLAQQHFETFGDRFADTPVTIESVSRFRSGKEQKDVLERVAAGRVDILIGTHTLLGPEVRYRDLGLVVIDEEHRFGVRQKDRLKALRASVDILTLTATPIPRTLNMAMAGLRDLSIIGTPPARRLAVKTFVQRHEDALVRDALERELRRGGQVFLLHNDVQTIERRAGDVERLVPHARVGIAHGQMRERDLERVMSDFYHKRFDVLCCTTIIETGIDIPSANTIVIERADRFGLAQLHQLRGRVGRSHHQAYAFLLTPDARAMTPDAVKRLEAIAATDSLGAGFQLATHDLEIRGAGELLGEEQSGQIQAIGYTLYMDLLTRAVAAMRAGRDVEPELAARPALEIDLRLPALIPDDYLPDVHNRLILYKRVGSAAAEEELQRLENEIIDRFGPLPPPTRTLLRIARLRVAAEPLGIVRIEATASGGLLEFGANPRIDPLTIVDLVQHDPRRYRLDGATRLRFVEATTDAEARIGGVERLVTRLGAPVAARPAAAAAAAKAERHQRRSTR